MFNLWRSVCFISEIEVITRYWGLGESWSEAHLAQNEWEIKLDMQTKTFKARNNVLTEKLG